VAQAYRDETVLGAAPFGFKGGVLDFDFSVAVFCSVHAVSPASKGSIRMNPSCPFA
jgi:hypothetical protein